MERRTRSASPWTQPGTSFRKDVTIDGHHCGGLHEGNRAIRVGQWKLVAAANEPWELYDCSIVDAEPQNNLAAKMPDKVKNWKLFGNPKQAISSN